MKLFQRLFVVATVCFITPTFAAETLKDLQGNDMRLGVAALDTATQQTLMYHANERFPMNCTSKFMVAAAILKKSETDPALLQEKMNYSQKDIIEASPISEKHLAEGSMTIADLCAAAVEYSDNTAGNLLLTKLGGPTEVNKFAKSIGDKTFRMDRWYPFEGMAANPHDVRDSDTPLAMMKNLQNLVLGNALAAPQREILQNWLKATVTGPARIRAGVPQSWVIGHKTGTGFYFGGANDIAIIWPPKCSPIILTVYTIQNKKDTAKREDVIADSARIVLKQFATSNACLKNVMSAT